MRLERGFIIRQQIDLCRAEPLLSLRRIKSFAFARLASPRREFSARRDSTWLRVTKVYSTQERETKNSISYKNVITWITKMKSGT